MSAKGWKRTDWLGRTFYSVPAQCVEELMIDVYLGKAEIPKTWEDVVDWVEAPETPRPDPWRRDRHAPRTELGPEDWAEELQRIAELPHVKKWKREG